VNRAAVDGLLVALKGRVMLVRIPRAGHEHNTVFRGRGFDGTIGLRADPPGQDGLAAGDGEGERDWAFKQNERVVWICGVRRADDYEAAARRWIYL